MRVTRSAVDTWAWAAPAQSMQASATTVREAERIIAGDIFGE